MPRKKLEPWFKTQLLALDALSKAREATQWNNVAAALSELCDSRQLEAKCARNGKRVLIIDTIEAAEEVQECGRFLVKPPLVARDASIFEHAFRKKGISALVICREPVTQLGRCPVVSLGTGVNVRVQVEEPDNPDKPSCGWFDHSLEELGNHVIEQINSSATIQRQLDYLLAHISALPMHVGIYKSAISLCDALESQNV